MGRLWSFGAEAQSTTAGVEWDQTTGTAPTIETTIVRSGNASLHFHPSAAVSFISKQLFVTSSNAHVFGRTWINIPSFPGTNSGVLAAADGATTGSSWDGIMLKTDGTLVAANSSGIMAGAVASPVLSLNTQHCIEFELQINSGGTGYIRCYLDGVLFDTRSSLTTFPTLTNGWVGFFNSTTAEGYFDDVAFNDNTGTVSNGLCGPGKIIHVHPGSAGDNAQFATVVGGTNNWDRVAEVTPDDLTTYNARTTASTPIDDHVLANSGLDLNTVQITLVQVVVRAGSDSTTATARTLVVRLKSQPSGTTSASASFAVATNGFATNGSAAPHTAKLTLYTDPQNGGPWTPALLATAQIGYQADTSSVNAVRVSTIWLVVEYVEGVYNVPSTSRHPGKGSSSARFWQTYGSTFAVTLPDTTVADTPEGGLGGTNTETVTIDVSIADTSLGGLGGLATESTIIDVLTSDTVYGSLGGIFTETVTVGVSTLDTSLGGLGGTNTETVVIDVTTSDTVSGGLGGVYTEAVTNDILTSDTSLGGLGGIATETITVGISVTDTALGSLGGLYQEAIAIDMFANDTSYGGLGGVSTETQLNDFGGPDTVYGALGGLILEAAVIDVLISDTVLGSLGGIAPGESAGPGISIDDIVLGGLAGEFHETVTFDTTIADAAYGSLGGVVFEGAILDQVTQDKTLGSLGGLFTESVTLDVFGVDQLLGALGGLTLEVVVQSVDIQDAHPGSLGGLSVETVVIDGAGSNITVFDIMYGGLGGLFAEDAPRTGDVTSDNAGGTVSSTIEVHAADTDLAPTSISAVAERIGDVTSNVGPRSA